MLETPEKAKTLDSSKNGPRLLLLVLLQKYEYVILRLTLALGIVERKKKSTLRIPNHNPTFSVSVEPKFIPLCDMIKILAKAKTIRLNTVQGWWQHLGTLQEQNKIFL